MVLRLTFTNSTEGFYGMFTVLYYTVCTVLYYTACTVPVDM